MSVRMLTLVGVGACAHGVPTPLTPPSLPATVECTGESITFSPAPSAQAVFYRVDDIWVEVPSPLFVGGTAALWAVDDLDGSRTAVPGLFRVEEGEVRGRLVLEPDEPLDANTLYEAEYTFCEGTDVRRSNFRTGLTGSPFDLDSVGEVSFLLRITEAEFLAPSSLLGTNVSNEGADLLITRVASPDSLSWMTTATRPFETLPGPCVPTSTLSLEDAGENPWFVTTAPSGTAYFPTLGFGVGLRIRGALDPSGSALEGAEVDILLPDENCDVLEQFYDCGPCDDGSGLFCAVAEIIDIPVEVAPPFPVRTLEEIAEDASCTTP